MLRQCMERGLPINNLMENWDFLQVRKSVGECGRVWGTFTTQAACTKQPVGHCERCGSPHV